ncbi:MAG TPA: FAD:protein FMN transferase [Candidatus Dormibacteraeota bacterium]
MPHRHFEALGTTCSLFVAGAPAERLERGEAWVRALQVRLTRFEPDSELSRLNAAAGSWAPISAELEDLLREALRAWELSGGLVNVAVLSAMHAIGYTRSLREGPTAAAALAMPLAPLPEVLEVAPGRARLAPGTGLDLGGLAKGWMADRLAERLGENALANLGGDLAARGGGPEGEGWPVAFGGRTVLLRDQAAATSSTRRRAWDLGGERVHHLIDPRTGAPARGDLGEVSVVARSAVEAEVLAKAALLLGADEAPAYLAGKALAWWLA